MLHLLANDPQRAVSTLQFATYVLKRAIKRQEEKKARTKRAEREERKRQFERTKTEREERRLPRERERARKRLGLGVRGVASTIIDFRRPPLIAAEEKKEIATLLGQIMRAICDEKFEDAEELVHRLICIRALGKGGDG
jgi:hypothetical protein